MNREERSRSFLRSPNSTVQFSRVQPTAVVIGINGANQDAVFRHKLDKIRFIHTQLFFHNGLDGVGVPGSIGFASPYAGFSALGADHPVEPAPPKLMQKERRSVRLRVPCIANFLNSRLRSGVFGPSIIISSVEPQRIASFLTARRCKAQCTGSHPEVNCKSPVGKWL